MLLRERLYRMTPSRATFWTGMACLLAIGCEPKRPVALKATLSPPTAVQTVAVEVITIAQTSRQPATLHAHWTAAVRARASGFVRELQVDLGDHVTKGDLLATIDVPELDQRRKVLLAKIERLEAQQRRAEAGVELSKSQTDSSQAKLLQAESEVASVAASLAAAQAEFDRTQDMVARGSLQSRVLDEVRQKRDTEKARERSIQAAVDAAKASVAVTKAETEAAQADVESAVADTEIARRELEELDAKLQFANIAAPVSGVVSARNVEPGDLVRESNDVGAARPLFVISQTDQIRVRMAIPESDAPRVQVGDQVTVTLPSFTEEPVIETSVSRVSGIVDPDTRMMTVEAIVPNEDGRLLPGMFGEAVIQLDSKIAANRLPARAVRFDETGNAYVYILSPDDTVSKVSVSTGIDDGNHIEIVSGIVPDQRVIDAHLKRFADGEKVRVIGKVN